jgi:hypothetical protein
LKPGCTSTWFTPQLADVLSPYWAVSCVVSGSIGLPATTLSLPPPVIVNLCVWPLTDSVFSPRQVTNSYIDTSPPDSGVNLKS